MEKKSSLLAFTFLTFLNVAPSYAVNFISGTTPISSNNESYLWIQNTLDCEITAKAWISNYDYQKINNNFLVIIDKNIKKDEKAIVKIINKTSGNNKEAWLNILQLGVCGGARLTRLNIN